LPYKPLKIYLADLVHDYLPGNYIVPLNIGLIAIYLKEQFGNKVEIKLFKSFEKLLDEFQKFSKPDIVGFSNYSWNQELNRHLMNLIISSSPKTVIVAGGPHIRTDPNGIKAHLEDFADIDYYCMFEGEIPFGNLIEYFLSKEQVVKKNYCDKEISGVAYVKDNKLFYPIITNQGRTITDIPSPYLSGILDDFLISNQWVPILETNRGCPYSCTFCVWGISALDKVRVFPLERSLQEIEYVAERSSSPRWVFADANFGILPRDLDLARKIREVADKHGKLKMVQVWWAKNSSKHTLEISKIFGSLADPLAAVQSLDETVLKNIKRDNIKLNTMTDLLEHWNKENINVSTDVLVGLPGESLESHLKTLRQVLEYGFSDIGVGNIRLLPGSEMEGDQCRQTFGLKTKYRLISGSYGKYDGTPIFEFEESVRSSNDIEEEEMHYLRIIHFFIWAFWNLGIAKPLLKWIQIESGKNPLDVLMDLAKHGRDPDLDKFVAEFDVEARTEWFDTSNALIQHYTKNFDQLIADGFLKLNHKYLAKILLSKKLAKFLINALVRQNHSHISEQLGKFCYDRIFFIDSPISKKIAYDKDTISALKMIYPYANFESNTCFFEQQEGAKEAIDFELEKFGFDKDPLRALTLAEESYRNRFLYDFSFSLTGRKESTGEFIGGSFDYHAQLGPIKSQN
jgi:putative methyltransferase